MRNPTGTTQYGSKIEAVAHKGCGILMARKVGSEDVYVCHADSFNPSTPEDRKLLDALLET